MIEIFALALAACASGDATCRHEVVPHGVMVYVCDIIPEGAHTQAIAETAWSGSIVIRNRPHHFHVAARCHDS